MTIVNKYEMIRNIFTIPLYEGSRTEGLVFQCSRYLSSRPKAFSKKRLLVRAMYLSFMLNYGHDYEKTKELYFGNSKVDKIEEVISVNYDLKYIENERRTNIPYLNQTNSYIGDVLYGISHNKLI
ncbi:hypothetical protein EII29_05135 [Leptotrichia sp. OH3620_COT-345]|uniref:hypothetical protein n=1 Tax=Leptotrichia sp. OH3620_COT-345 TaxID=2491048 RepID=UPI000F649217|nr:hypothetical protein [Leptotrichia sp. OH3620_COT-345]RRD39906.1 hypothetical protein EII29_05135 [Leptotrichia sp. OH3620_COT-345]